MRLFTVHGPTPSRGRGVAHFLALKPGDGAVGWAVDCSAALRKLTSSAVPWAPGVPDAVALRSAAMWTSA